MSQIKTAIVTAAAGAGIGAAIARQLAADGMRVVVTDLHEGRMTKLAGELSQVAGVECPWYSLVSATTTQWGRSSTRWPRGSAASTCW